MAPGEEEVVAVRVPHHARGFDDLLLPRLIRGDQDRRSSDQGESGGVEGLRRDARCGSVVLPEQVRLSGDVGERARVDRPLGRAHHRPGRAVDERSARIDAQRRRDAQPLFPSQPGRVVHDERRTPLEHGGRPDLVARRPGGQPRERVMSAAAACEPARGQDRDVVSRSVRRVEVIRPTDAQHERIGEVVAEHRGARAVEGLAEQVGQPAGPKGWTPVDRGRGLRGPEPNLVAGCRRRGSEHKVETEAQDERDDDEHRLEASSVPPRGSGGRTAQHGRGGRVARPATRSTPGRSAKNQSPGPHRSWPRVPLSAGSSGARTRRHPSSGRTCDPVR